MLIKPHRICGVSNEKGKVFMNGQKKCIAISKDEYCLLGYNAVKSGGCQPTFERNTSPPSSGQKSKPSKKPA
jgi:hypothetical protein